MLVLYLIYLISLSVNILQAIPFLTVKYSTVWTVLVLKWLLIVHNNGIVLTRQLTMTVVNTLLSRVIRFLPWVSKSWTSAWVSNVNFLCSKGVRSTRLISYPSLVVVVKKSEKRRQVFLLVGTNAVMTLQLLKHFSRLFQYSSSSSA